MRRLQAIRSRWHAPSSLCMACVLQLQKLITVRWIPPCSKTVLQLRQQLRIHNRRKNKIRMFSRRWLGLRKRWALNIFSDLYTTTVAEHRLNTLFWECTLRCNLACRHCGSDCRVDPQVPDMPLADFLKVLDDQITPHVDPTEVLIIFPVARCSSARIWSRPEPR